MRGVAVRLRPFFVCGLTLGVPPLAQQVAEWCVLQGERGGRLMSVLMLLHPDDLFVVEAGDSGNGFQINTLREHVLHELPFSFVQSLHPSFHPSLFNTLFQSLFKAFLDAVFAGADDGTLDILVLQYAFLVFFSFHVGQFCYPAFFNELPENALFLCAVVPIGAAADGGEQLEPSARVGIIQNLVFNGCKFTQFDEKKGGFVAENFIGLVLEHNLVEITVIASELRCVVVQQVEGIDRRNCIVAFSFFHFPADDPAHVRDDSVGEEGLSSPLHLDDESVAVLVFAIDVENHPLVFRPLAEHLCLQEGDVGDDADFIGNAGIEEVNEDVLVVFGGGDPLEAEIGQRIEKYHVFLHSKMF